MGAASEVTLITNKRKMGASDESSPTTQEKSNVQSTDMDIVAGEDGSPTMKKIKTEEMKIYVKIIKTISLGVISSDTIKDVKAKYRNMVGDTSNDEELFFAGDHLKNDKKLIDNGIHDGSTVHMFLQAKARMQIRIKLSIDDKGHKVEVLKRDTVQNIKAIVRDICSNRASKQLDLIYSGKQLDDCQTLAFYNIQHDSTLCAVFANDGRIELRVNTPNNGMVAFEVKLEYTLEDVKMMIESMGMPMDNHNLLIYARGVMYDHLTLRELNFYNGTRMDVVPYQKSNVHSTNMEATVSYQKSNVHSTNMEATADVPQVVKKIKAEGSLESPMSQEVNLSYTIEDVKLMIESMLRIPVDRQELVFSTLAGLVYDHQTLKEWKATSGTMMELEMRNYLKVTRTITVGVYNSNTIDNVKAKFCEMDGVAANLQNVLFTGNHLKHNQALDYDIQDGSSVHMILHSGAAMKIHVKASWSGKTIALDVLSWDTIQNVKAKFQDKEGTPTNKLALIHNGKQLEDSQTLAASNIQSGSTLYAVFCGGDRIEISVRTPAQESFKIEVKLWYTIENVKTVIESMTEVLVNRQTLTFAGEELVNDRILASYKNIKTESVLHLTIDMQIFVRSLNGKTITIDVKSSDTIKDVKKKISTKENIPWDKQMLLFERKHLGNNVTLADYNIQRDTTLILSLLRCYC